MPWPKPTCPLESRPRSRRAGSSYLAGSISKDVRLLQHIFDNTGLPDTLNTAVTGTMVATDPPDHTRLRKLAAKAFTSNAIQQLRPRAEQITTELLNAMEPQGSADLIEAFAYAPALGR